MSMAGKIVCGSFDVLIGGAQAARKSDLSDHAGVIASGCETVVINGTALLAARVGDSFLCPSSDGGAPHVGGIVLPPGCPSVLIGGRFAARSGDLTVCLGPGGNGGGGDGSGDGGGGTPGPAASECGQLWAGFQAEALNKIAAGDGDHRARNKLISSAYADLYLENHDFAWAGLAAYASKQVGCAMDQATKVRDATPGPPPRRFPSAAPGQDLGGRVADYAYDMLGQGNRDLFLDVYPMHRFYQEYGGARLAQCAAERVPPVPAQALDAFRALDKYKLTGDKKYLDQHVASMAWHEQVSILQREVYNDAAMEGILRLNETGLPPGQPAIVVMGPCCDPTKAPVHTFGDKGRTKIYDVSERMDWILNEVAKDYSGFAGSDRHKRDLEHIRGQGDAWTTDCCNDGAP